MQALEADRLLPLVLAGLEARKTAYCPYSNFRVGAALLTANGETITGCNIENASYGGAICAERTALVKAVSKGDKTFRALVVTSDVPEPTTSPCGICRQFIREFCPLDMPIYMIASTFPADAPQEQALAALADYKYVKVMSLEQLLPMSFGPGNLEVPRQ